MLDFFFLRKHFLILDKNEDELEVEPNNSNNENDKETIINLNSPEKIFQWMVQEENEETKKYMEFVKFQFICTIN